MKIPYSIFAELLDKDNRGFMLSTSNEIPAFARFDYRNDLFRIDPWP